MQQSFAASRIIPLLQSSSYLDVAESLLLVLSMLTLFCSLLVSTTLFF